MALNPKQFRQGRLFAPLGMTKKPHQMTPLEFANSPRTVFHGSDSFDFEDIRSDESQSFRRSDEVDNWVAQQDPYDLEEGYVDPDDAPNQGFHVGSLAAAEERMRGRTKSGLSGAIHPLRINPDSLIASSRDNPLRDQGEDWNDEHHGHWYKNSYEDKGSLSAVLSDPGPETVTHYTDYIDDARRTPGMIPSAAGEHHVDQARRRTPDSPVPIQTPGLRRMDYESGVPEGVEVPSGFAYAGQHEMRSRRPPGRLYGLGAPEQPSMFKNADTFNAQGERSGSVIVPDPRALPDEAARAAWDAEDNARRAPWEAKVAREWEGLNR